MYLELNFVPAWVIVKEHYTDESYHEILCVCQSKNVAEAHRKFHQDKIDPEYNEWKIEMYYTNLELNFPQEMAINEYES